MKRIVIAASFAVLPSCSSDDGGEPAAHQLALAEAPEVQCREVEPEPGIARSWVCDPVYSPSERDPNDADRDGVPSEADPDDENDTIFPGAPEVPCNGEDEDGDGVDPCPPDVDGDGASADVDCDDHDLGKGPRAREILCNGLDENCDGADDCDLDLDGVEDREDLDPRDPDVGSGRAPPVEPTL